MNKKELLQKADELIKKANELKGLANQEEEIILVPDEIKITKSTYWYSKAIINKNHELYYNYHNENWAVSSDYEAKNLIKCKLTPCKYEYLKPWDLFYFDDNKKSDLKDLFWYAIKLNDWTYQGWDGKDCRNSNHPWEYYWKVEPFNL